MARLARVVVPGFPYHVTHRGNRRAAIFFSDNDREYYLALLAEQAAAEGLDIWAWCLMTNHVHLIVVPHTGQSMARAIGKAHMRYARYINRDHGWSGHLWANRYHSTALDWDHQWHAVRYVELNPVRARMASRQKITNGRAAETMLDTGNRNCSSRRSARIRDMWAQQRGWNGCIRVWRMSRLLSG